MAALIRSTPDPSVALGSPHWLPNRGAALGLLERQGRGAEARPLRTTLDRRDLRELLEPFWLLAPEDADRLGELALWLAPGVPAPSRREWTWWLDRRCREIEEAP